MVVSVVCAPVTLMDEEEQRGKKKKKTYTGAPDFKGLLLYIPPYQMHSSSRVGSFFSPLSYECNTAARARGMSEFLISNPATISTRLYYTCIWRWSANVYQVGREMLAHSGTLECCAYKVWKSFRAIIYPQVKHSCNNSQRITTILDTRCNLQLGCVCVCV